MSRASISQSSARDYGKTMSLAGAGSSSHEFSSSSPLAPRSQLDQRRQLDPRVQIEQRRQLDPRSHLEQRRQLAPRVQLEQRRPAPMVSYSIPARLWSHAGRGSCLSSRCGRIARSGAGAATSPARPCTRRSRPRTARHRGHPRRRAHRRPTTMAEANLAPARCSLAPSLWCIWLPSLCP